MATGIANAWMDRDPVIAVTGNITSQRYNTSTHQVMDTVGFYKPITKWSTMIDPGSAAETMHKAIRVATSERPGPVHLTLPSNWAKVEAGGKTPTSPAVRPLEGLGCPSKAAVQAAAELINGAKRPVIVAGLGILRSRAERQLVALAERLGAAVVVVPKAKGVIPEDHPLFGGVFEMLGDKLVLEFVGRADLIISCGFDTVEFDKPWSFAAPVIHLGTMANEDEFYQAEVELVGHPVDALEALTGAVGAKQAWSLPELAQYRSDLLALITRPGNGMASHEVVRAARRLLPKETIATTDVGAHKFLVGQLWTTYAPRTFFMSNGLSGMGYGFPAALAAQLAHPDKPVIAFLGDGGFGMYMGELETAQRLNLPLIVVVLCDETLSLIAMAQERRGLEHHGVHFTNPDIAKVAEAFGARGKRCSTVEEIEAAIAEAYQARRLTVIQAMVDPAPYRL